MPDEAESKFVPIYRLVFLRGLGSGDIRIEQESLDPIFGMLADIPLIDDRLQELMSELGDDRARGKAELLSDD
jgi:hypothetical protein